MKNKFISMLLMISVVLSSFMLLTACDGSKDNDTNTDSESGTTVTETSIAMETTEYKPELPEIKYDNYTMKFLVMGDSYNHYQSKEIGAAEETGDIINDAVYRRNMEVEKDLGVLIESIPSNSIIATAKKVILSGGHDYDVIMPIVDEGVKAIQPGLFYDLNKVPYLNLKNPWWDPRMTENLTIDGQSFFATGDISILDNECTMVVFFNKGIIKDRALENPYELVNSGKWTLDKEYELSKGVTQDLNGDGKYTCPEDIFGMQVSMNTPHSMFYASGERVVSKNADGDYEFTMYNPRAVDVVTKALEICADSLNLTSKTKGGNDYTVYIPAFGAGKVLFEHLALTDINFFRNDNVDFGILPYPKYEESQANYNNFVSTILVPGVAIPGNAENLDRTGAVLESMAYHSVKTLTYAYYDQTLNNRLIRDTESSEMLDIIFKTRVYDMGFMFDWGGLGKMLESMHGARKTDFASEYEKRIDKAIAAKDSAFEAFAQGE